MDDPAAPLAAIKAALQRLGRQTLLRSLQQGLPASDVRSALDGASLWSTSDLEVLYGWHNGTSTAAVSAVDDIHLFPGFYLLSLEDALTNRQAFASDSRWMDGWHPLFANGGGDFYVLDLGSSGDGAVRRFRIEESEHPVEFGSLGAMLTTLAAAFEREVFRLDSDRYLEMDDRVFAALAAELNPDVAWWRDRPAE